MKIPPNDERLEEENLAKEIDKMLAEHGHTRDEIVCVLWGDDKLNNMADLSIDLDSFWKYAEKTFWDREDWVSGPHYPLCLLSGKGWWIDSTDYDSRTYLGWHCEPKAKPMMLALTENGGLTAINSSAE